MRVGHVTLHNFGPFEHVEFDLSRPGLTGIEGITETPGCASNGAGKSYLLGGVSWVLFDDPMRDRVGKDDLIRIQFARDSNNQLRPKTTPKGRSKYPEDGCYGIVHVVGGDEPIRIERYRRHPEHGNKVRLFVGGAEVTRGRDAMTNEAIVDLLGMDFRTFINSVAFGARAEVKSFFATTDADRKQILERILGLEVYSAAERVAQTRLKAKVAEISDTERRIERLEARIEEAQGQLAEVATDEELEELRFELARHRARLLAGQRRAEAMRAEFDEAEQQLADEQSKHSRAVQVYRRARAAYEEKRRTLSGERRQVEQDLAGARRDVQAAERRAAKWDELSGSECVTCHQVLAPAAARQLRRADEREAATAAGAVEELEAALQPIQEALMALEAPEEPTEPEGLGERRQGRQEILEALREFERTNRELAAEESAFRAQLAGAEEHRQRLRARIEEHRAELSQLREGIEGAQRDIDRLQFWAEGFGRQGIVSYLIEAEVPAINRAATRYARQLLGPGATVRLSATRELKSGATRDEVMVHGSIPGCCDSYANASTGQKRRLDLPLLLAFRDVVSARSGRSFDQMFADELFDGLDEAGEDAIVALLREIAQTCPVTLVTHSERLKAACDHVITVEHRDGVAQIV